MAGPKFKNSTFKKLWSLFRRGSLLHTRLRPDLDKREELTSFSYDFGVSKTVLNSSNWYNVADQFAQGPQTRISRYSEYNQMEQIGEIHTALNLVADESTSRSENDEVLYIECKDDAIKSQLETLFFDILDINFYCWSWARTLCKYGDLPMYLDVDPNDGIKRAITIPVDDFDRIEGSIDDPKEIKYKWNSKNLELENWQVAHFRLLGHDQFLPFGTSYIEGARPLWRKLILMEDAMLVYRVTRAPERRVFYVDVNGVQPSEVDKFVAKVAENLKRTKIVNNLNGQIDQRFNPLDVSEDYFIPQRGDSNNKIESLPGGQSVNDIEDVEYILKKLIASLGIPRAYLTYEEDLSNKSTLASLDIRFSRTIERIQRAIIAELTKIALVHLVTLGVSNEELFKFDIRLTNPSSLASMQKLELLERRVQVANSLQNESLFDRGHVYREFFNITKDEQERIIVGRMRDAHNDGLIENIKNSATQEGAGDEEGGFGGGGGGGGLTDLGGEEFGEPGEPGEPSEPGEAEEGEIEIPGEEIVTASNDAFDKSKKKRTAYQQARYNSKNRTKAGMVDLSKYTSLDDDDTSNDPFGKKTFRRLIKGVESEGLKINKKRILNEIKGLENKFKRNDEFDFQIDEEVDDLL